MHPSPHPRRIRKRSERVILRRYLNREELVQDGNLLHDVVAHLGDFGEEEEGEESGYTAEAGGEATAGMGLVRVGCMERWREVWEEWGETYYFAACLRVRPW